MSAPRLTEPEVVALLAAHEGFAWHVAQRALPHAGDRDRLEEVAAQVRLYLVLAALKYDPGRGRSFLGFVGDVPLHAARRFVRAERLKGVTAPARAGVLPVVRSLDAPLRQGNETRTLADTVPARLPSPQPVECVAGFWAVVAEVGRLTPGERVAVELRFQRGAPFAEIGRAAGVNAARAKLLLNTALTKLRASADRLLPQLLIDGETRE